MEKRFGRPCRRLNKHDYGRTDRLGSAVLCLAMLVAGADGLNAQMQSGDFVAGRLLVQFKAGVPDSVATGVLSGLQSWSAGQIPQIGIHIVQLPPGARENELAHELRRRPEVGFAELDRVVPPAAITPNDPYYANWEWHLPKISAPAAWSTTAGSSNVVIAIIDTGVESTHQDLSAKLVPGWNIYNNDSDTADVYGHGTLVAGAAAAITDNGLGVASVCWQCMIMPVRVSDTSGKATFSNLAAGVTRAADYGARVANMSYQVSTSSTITSAAQYFMSKGGVVTSAAGNAGLFVTVSPNAYMLTIGGSDPNDRCIAGRTTATISTW
ncbi:MAG: S8 family serine peptidase [Bryobacteraceae bacterium]